jgi:hypothetical protein
MADPVALGESYTVDAGTNNNLAYNFDVGFWGIVLDYTLLRNDKDADGDKLSITDVDGNTLVDGSVTVVGDNGGVFTILSDGTMSFDASTGFESLSLNETLVTSVTYTVSDGNGGTTTATASVTVVGQNDTVFAIDDSTFVTDEDSVLAPGFLNLILDNDIAYNGTIQITAVDGDTNFDGQVFVGSDGGLFSVAVDGSVSFDPNGEFEYLGDGESAETSVTYTVTGEFGESSTANVTVTVNGVNDAVDAQNDAGFEVSAGDQIINDGTKVGYGDVFYESVWGITLDNGLLRNDQDAEGDEFSITQVDGVALVDGTVSVAGDQGGMFTITDIGQVSFDATTGFEYLLAGESVVSQVEYTVEDSFGNASSAFVSVTVNGRGGDSVVATDEGLITDQNTSVIGSVNTILDNDYSVIGEQISLVSVNGDPANIGQTVAGYNGGLFNIDGVGNVSFDPNGEFDDLAVGESVSTSVWYQVQGENGETDSAYFYATVTGTNDAVDAVDLSYQANADEVTEVAGLVDISYFGSTLTLDQRVLSSASDIDGDDITVSELGGEALVAGTASFVGDNGGLFTITEDGTVTFEGNGDFDLLETGSSSMTSVSYTVSDGNGATDTATISVDVQGAYEVVANDDAISFAQGATGIRGAITSSDLLGNDFGTGSITNIDLSGSSFLHFGLVGLNEINAEGLEAVGGGNTYFTNFAYTIEDALGNSDTATVNVEHLAGYNYKIEQPFTDVQINESDVYTLDLNSLFTGVAASTYTIDFAYGDSGGLEYSNLINEGFTVNDLGGGIFEISGPDLAFGEAVGNTISLRAIDLDLQQEIVTVDVSSAGTELEALTGVQTDLASDDVFNITESQIGVVLGNVLANDASGLQIVSFDRVGESNYLEDPVTVSNLVADGATQPAGSFWVDGFNSTADGIAPGQVLTQQYDYTVVDQNGNYDTATVTLNITGQQDGIGLNSNQQTIVRLSEDTTLTFDDTILVGNARDIDADGYLGFGDGLFSDNVDASGLSGSLVDNGDGSFTYDPTVAHADLNDGDAVLERVNYDIVSVDGSVRSTYLDIVVYGSDDPIV